jgi:hypothetical protein
VRDDHAASENARSFACDVFDARRRGEILVAQTRQSLHHQRKRVSRANQPRDRAKIGASGIEQDDSDLDDLGAAVLRETGGLEVDDRQRPGALQEGRQRTGIDPERDRLRSSREQQAARRRFRP